MNPIHIFPWASQMLGTGLPSHLLFPLPSPLFTSLTIVFKLAPHPSCLYALAIIYILQLDILFICLTPPLESKLQTIRNVSASFTTVFPAPQIVPDT